MYRRSKLAVGGVVTTVLLSALLTSTGGAQFKLARGQQTWVEQTLAKMTVDEKVGALIFPVASGTFTSESSDEFQAIRDNIQKYHVGGYHIEGDGGNPASAALLIAHMQRLASIPLLLTADFEGGAGSEFPGGTRFPRGMAMGATGNPQYAYDAARLTAREARAMGIAVNFYPVVDVNNNPRNPIINIRSFGSDPATVGKFGAAYVRGSQDAGVIATAKHFPGHGDTAVNSHLQLPVLDFDRSRLDRIELPPFEAAIEAGVDAVMTAHIYESQIEKTPGLPGSLSPAVTTGLLRQDLGFKGVVFTDALVMHAITNGFGAEQAVVMAIKAGADVALEPADVPKSYAALKGAVERGEISPERLDASVRRLLEAKAWAGLAVRAVPDLNQLDTLVGTREAEDKATEIMEHAVTVVKDERHAIPLKPVAEEDVLLVNFTDEDNPELTGHPGETFRAEFLKRHARTLCVEVPQSITGRELDLIEQLLPRYRMVVVTATVRIASYKRGPMGLNETQLYLLNEIAHHEGPAVVAVFGSPYLLNDVPDLPAYAVAYETYSGAESAMVRALFGEIPFRGRLPVPVASFPVGFGL